MLFGVVEAVVGRVAEDGILVGAATDRDHEDGAGIVLLKCVLRVAGPVAANAIEGRA